MKNNKKLLLVLSLVIVMIVPTLTGCGGSSSVPLEELVIGNWEEVTSAYVTSPEEMTASNGVSGPEDNEFTFNEDGTASVNYFGTAYEATWALDGEAVTVVCENNSFKVEANALENALTITSYYDGDAIWLMQYGKTGTDATEFSYFE